MDNSQENRPLSSPLKTPLDKAVLFIATGFGSGFLAVWGASKISLLKIAALPERWTGAGLLGSLVGMGMIGLGIQFVGWQGGMSLILLTGFAVLIAGRAEKMFGTKDDARIVIDEIVGMLWSIAFIALDQFVQSQKIFLLVLAFALFRIFDVAKWPFRNIQNLQGGVGIVADDLCAGLLTNLVLQLWVRFVF